MRMKADQKNIIACKNANEFQNCLQGPGADNHSLATCFHVLVGRPPTCKNKIIHRHTYNPLDREESWVHPFGDHISAPSRPNSAIYGYVHDAVKALHGAEPKVPGPDSKILLRQDCKELDRGIKRNATTPGWQCQTFPGCLCGNKKSTRSPC